MDGELIAGFELPDDKSVTDLDLWIPFQDWMLERHGYVNAISAQDRELFEAFMAGAYWQSRREI